MERYETASDSSGDERESAAAARPDPEVLAVYESGGVTTTVTAIAMNSDRCSQASLFWIASIVETFFVGCFVFREGGIGERATDS